MKWNPGFFRWTPGFRFATSGLRSQNSPRLIAADNGWIVAEMDSMLINHALVLNLHQPSGNLPELLSESEWEAREILFAMDRMPRSLWAYEDSARVHLSISGTLLETLTNLEFQRRVYGIVDCGSLLWYLQNTRIFDILGTGYYHPVFPLIPKEDRYEHVQRWLGMAKHVFWRDRFGGFWPPEMGFSMDMIPLLQASGYRYVLVDSEHVEPVTPMRWEEVRYRPHVARFGGAEIIVVVRDRDLSNAQESGMDFGWFQHEVRERTKWCDFTPLVTTCTDGENGGWFRNTSQLGNFWGVFYHEYLEGVKHNTHPIRPTFIDEYLDQHGVLGEVRVREGAWNTGWHDGVDFTQWKGSQLQRDALQRVSEVSQQFQQVRTAITDGGERSADIVLEEAHWHLLRAQTSCNFFWGEAWVNRCHADLDYALKCLPRMETKAA